MNFKYRSWSKLSWLTGMSAVLAFTVIACGDDDDDAPPVIGSGGSGGTGGTGTGGTGTGGIAGTGGVAGTGGIAGTGGMAGEGGMGGTAGAAMAMLRVVHTSPTAPDVDLYVAGNSTPVAAGLAYGASTPYLELPPGSYDFEIRAAGAPATDPPAFEISQLAVAGDTKYTAIAAGDLGSTSPDDQFRVLAFEEAFGAASAGNARVRIVHASFDAPSVDLDVGNDDPASPELAGLDRFAETGADGVELPAAQALQLGIAAGGNTVTAFTTPELPDGGELFVVATGQLGLAPRDAKGFSLLAVLPDSTTAWIPQNPFVYALHASPDAPAVDIYAGDAEIFDNVPFGIMGRVQVPPGMYTLDFFAGQAGATPRPAGAPAASADTPPLDAGESYIAIATGLLGGSGTTAFQLIPLAEGFDPVSASSARLQVVHASPDAPPVDIGTVSTPGTLDANPPITNAAFGDFTAAAGLELPATSLTLGVASSGSMSTVAEFDVTLTDGQRLIAVAAGLLTPPASEPLFQLLVIDATDTSILSPWTVASLSPNP